MVVILETEYRCVLARVPSPGRERAMSQVASCGSLAPALTFFTRLIRASCSRLRVNPGGDSAGLVDLPVLDKIIPHAGM